MGCSSHGRLRTAQKGAGCSNLRQPTGLVPPFCSHTAPHKELGNKTAFAAQPQHVQFLLSPVV
jgi:hypothetical protein